MTTLTNSQKNTIAEINRSPCHGQVFNFYQTSFNRIKVQIKAEDFEYTMTIGKRGGLYE